MELFLVIKLERSFHYIFSLELDQQQLKQAALEPLLAWELLQQDLQEELLMQQLFCAVICHGQLWLAGLELLIQFLWFPHFIINFN